MSAWTEATLCTDEDLRAYESTMPDHAKSVRNHSGSATPYDGKRELAKEHIGLWIQRRGLKLEGILYPSEFRRCAVFLELALIYEDLALRSDMIAAEKTQRYMQKYEDEIEEVRFTYGDPDQNMARSLGIPLWRC